MVSAGALLATLGSGAVSAAPSPVPEPERSGDASPWEEPVVPAPWEGQEPVEGGEPVAPREVEPVSVAPEPVEPGTEVLSERTATSKTFTTDEAGVFETELFAEPVHVRAESVTGEPVDVNEGPGEWVDVDTALVEDEEGRLKGTAVEGGTTIATQADEGELVRVDLSEGAYVAWGLQVPQGQVEQVTDAQAAVSLMAQPQGDGRGEVEGDTVTFDEVAPDVDVAITSRATGVKEDLVLASADVPVVYDFPLTVEGVTPVADGGGVQFLDTTGEVVGAIPAGFMVDANEEFSDGVDMDLIDGEAGQYTVRVSIDGDWLSDPERAFPVLVDPSVTLAGVEDTHVENTRPNTDLSGWTFMPVGRAADGTISRGFIQFDTSALDGKTINHAQLNLYNQQSINCTPSVLSVHRVTQAWSASQVRWPGPTWGPKVGEVTAANGASGCGAAWVQVEVSQAVRDWASGERANNGLSLHATEQSTAGYKRFNTVNHITNRPYLRVNWREPLLGVLGYYTLNTDDLTDRTQVHNNVANGNVVLQSSDVALPGVNGLGVDISRFYNSREDTANTRRGMTGTGWTMSLGQDVRLSVNGYDRAATFEGPTGYTMTIPWNRNAINPETGLPGMYERPVGLNATLRYVGGDYRTDHDYELEMHETQLTYHFTGSPKLSKITDKSGNEITMGYTGERLTSITDTKGDRSTLTYAGNLVTKVTDPDGRSVTYGYDGNLLTSATDATGATTTYAYNSDNVMSSVTDPNGGITAFTYDTSNRLTELEWANSTSATPAVTTYRYENNGLTVKMTDPKGDSDWIWMFDNLGRLEEHTRPGTGLARETYASNAFNLVTDYTNSTGGTQTLEYDGYNVLSITNNTDGAASTFTYGDENPNSPDSYTDPRGVVLNYNYDAQEQMSQVTSDNDGADSVTTMTYRTPAQTCSGEIASSTDGNGNTTSYSYNSRCLLTTITRPGPVGNTIMTYDSYDRTRSIRDGEGRRQILTYDANDKITQIDYQNPGQTSGFANRTNYTYDDNGNRTSRTDRVGNTSTQTSSWELDARNRVLVEELPDDVTNTYTYDPAGNLTSHDGPTGLTTYTYNNSNNRIDVITPPVGDPIEFAYYTDT